MQFLSAAASGDQLAKAIQEKQKKRDDKAVKRKLKKLEEGDWKEKLRHNLQFMSRKEALEDLVPVLVKKVKKQEGAAAEGTTQAEAQKNNELQDQAATPKKKGKLFQSLIQKAKEKAKEKTHIQVVKHITKEEEAKFKKESQNTPKKLQNTPKKLQNTPKQDTPKQQPQEKPQQKKKAKPEEESEDASVFGGPLEGKKIRVIKEAAGALFFGAEGMCKKHNLSTSMVLIELQDSTQTVHVQAEHCIEHTFSKKKPFPSLVSMTRRVKAQILRDLGLEDDPAGTSVTNEKSSWLFEDEVMYEVEHIKWAFQHNGYDLSKYSVAHPNLSNGWLSFDPESIESENVEMMLSVHEKQEKAMRKLVQENGLLQIPFFRSQHWCLLSYRFQAGKVIELKYWDSLTQASEACRMAAEKLVNFFSPELQVPLRQNKTFQPIGSALCGFYVLGYMEADLREWLGEGPAAIPAPGIQLPMLRGRLAAMSKALKAENEKRKEELQKERAKEKQLVQQALKAIENDIKASKKAKLSCEEAELAKQLSHEGHKFAMEDLSEKAKADIEKVRTNGVGVCGSCRNFSGCLRCYQQENKQANKQATQRNNHKQTNQTT